MNLQNLCYDVNLQNLCYGVNLQNFIRETLLAFQLQTTSQDTLDLFSLSLSLSLNPLTGTGHRPILKSKLHCMSQDLIPTRPVVFVFVFFFFLISIFLY